MVFNALIGSIALKTANCCCFILKIKQKKSQGWSLMQSDCPCFSSSLFSFYPYCCLMSGQPQKN